MSIMADENRSVTVVIFGASGDLTRRKLVPALFSLYRKWRLPTDFHILGVSTSAMSHDAFRARLLQSLEKLDEIAFSADEWQTFASRVFYQAGDFTDPSTYQGLSGAIAALETGPADRLYYLATPPRFFPEIVAGLGAAGLHDESDGWRRVVIEKPFGSDQRSAEELNRSIHKVLTERQVYRIDHYLGKETVQNILVFRFGNSLFEPVWNRNYVDHVQITVAEEVGVGHRAGYYDSVGVVRDMIQNHLFQLLTLVAMEPPGSFRADDLRNEKVKVLNAIRPILGDRIRTETVRGQYRGYREEPGVPSDSETATFAAIRLWIDSWRWQGVPFILRTGKRLAAKSSMISIQFKRPPQLLFPLPTGQELTPNILAMCLQPDEGMHLRFEAKEPDTVIGMRSVEMAFHYREAFGSSAVPEAYERLILDAIHGDASLFTRSDQIEVSWGLIDPIIAGWRAPFAPPLLSYEQGSWGPREADGLLEPAGRAWLPVCAGHES